MNILRRRLSEGVKGSVTLTYDNTTLSSATKIINDASSIAELTIDGIKQPSVVTSYTFTSSSTHTIICKFKGGKIGDNAFSDIYIIKDVNIDSDIIGIGKKAFSSCIGISSLLTIPKTVKYIEEGAFSGCYNIPKFTVASETIGDGAFSGCTNVYGFTLEEGVVNIGNKAFYFHSPNHSMAVTIPSSVKNIGDSAFYNINEAKCLPLTPPYAGINIFKSVNYRIYVPASSMTAYKQASGWSTYASYITSS